jgi:flagellar biosynthesis/type III secretory pathway M-ring protein FliF/YscJ
MVKLIKKIIYPSISYKESCIFCIFIKTNSMKNVLIIILILINGIGFAQKLDMEKLKSDIEKSTKQLEESKKRMDSSLLASAQRMDSINMVNFNKQNNRNLEMFLNERNQKIKKQNRIRIIYAISMISILIIGIILKKRRQKKTAASNSTNTTI